ncbi:unnamed protein product, partial [Brassica rapa]
AQKLRGGCLADNYTCGGQLPWNAESSWYMDEPVKMKKRLDQGKLNIQSSTKGPPKVCARDGKKQTCEFGENFWKLARASSGDQVKMWKECVSNKICRSKTRGRFIHSDSKFFFSLIITL